MKTLLKLKFFLPVLFLTSLFVVSCEDDDDEKDEKVEAVANFEYAVEGLKVTFTNKSVGAKTYSWNFGDKSDLVTTENAEHTYKEAGEYNVVLTITDADGGSKTAEQTVKVEATGVETAKADFSFEVDGLKVTFTDKSVGAKSYSWDFGDGSAMDTNPSPVHTYEKAGTYDVVLTIKDADDKEVKSEVQKVTVTEAVALKPDFTFEVEYLKVTFTNASVGAKTYSWNFGDDSDASTEPSPVHTYAKEGEYKVVLTATSEDGKTETVEKTVAVKALVLGQDLIKGGAMEAADEASWTVQAIDTYKMPEVKFGTTEAGTPTGGTDGALKVASTEGARVHVYQKVALKAGKYKLGGYISTTSEVRKQAWTDIFIGTVEPAASTVYSKNESGILGLTRLIKWEKESTTVLDGDFGTVGAHNSQWKYELEGVTFDEGTGMLTVTKAGDYYIVLYSGSSKATGVQFFDSISLNEIVE